MGLPLKLAVASAAVMSTAVMFNLLSPFFINFTISDLPILWTSSISTWLKPPYLYVVINCIIITIVASSRLQSKVDGAHSFSTFPEPVLLPTPEPVKVVLPVQLPIVYEPEAPVMLPAVGSRLVQVPVLQPEPEPEPEFSAPYDEELTITDKFMDEEMKIAKEAYEEIKKSSRVQVNNYKSVISMPAAFTPPSNMNQVELSLPTVQKPPASAAARFSHRKSAKGTLEGGRTLRVSKPKRQDTLETTWKHITEGRAVPLTRHLRKSDTWETDVSGRQTHNNSEEQLQLPINDNNHSDRMSKSDTYDVKSGGGGSSSRRKPPPAPSKLSRSGGSGRLKKEPSLGQEELNRRVEAFIRKFNEDMRLQRQESMNQYMEMINRGAR